MISLRQNGQLRQDMKALRAESLKRQRECDKLRNLVRSS